MNKELNIEAIFYLTKQCNYQCTYCYKAEQQIKGQLITQPRIKQFFKEVQNAKDNQNNNIKTNEFFLRVRGGEFSLDKNSLTTIEQLLQELINLNNLYGTKITFSFSTNLSGSDKFFKELNNLLLKYHTISNKELKVFIDISIHNEYFISTQKELYKIKFLNFDYINSFRIVFDNFELSEDPEDLNIQKNNLITTINKNLSDKVISKINRYKFSNNYGLYLDNRNHLETKILFDENLRPLINNKRGLFAQYLKRL
jgi:organic radical activating enzyme